MLGHSRPLSRAVAATMMPDRVQLYSTSDDLRWSGRANIQSLKEQIIETLAGHVVVELYALSVPVDAPTFGWTRAELTHSENPELIGVSLYVQTRPMDSYFAYKRFSLSRQQGAA